MQWRCLSTRPAIVRAASVPMRRSRWSARLAHCPDRRRLPSPACRRRRRRHPARSNQRRSPPRSPRRRAPRPTSRATAIAIRTKRSPSSACSQTTRWSKSGPAAAGTPRSRALRASGRRHLYAAAPDGGLDGIAQARGGQCRRSTARSGPPTSRPRRQRRRRARRQRRRRADLPQRPQLADGYDAKR